ncbi:MAG: hypothetical protein SPJ71_07605 [Candidatus Limisoma sp.]|nr:hypothetical protein [Candidatus Limisoma sp.]
MMKNLGGMCGFGVNVCFVKLKIIKFEQKKRKNGKMWGFEGVGRLKTFGRQQIIA